MTTAALTGTETLADLLRDLGDIPPGRVRRWPTPGTASEADLLEAVEKGGILCELVDGTLVEKPMGAMESGLALVIGRFILNYLDGHDLGLAFGPDAMLRLAPGLVRAPDISFVRWHKLPGRTWPRDPIPGFGPCLAIEVLSESNTGPEMRRKTQEYFDHGAELVWLVDPRRREVRVHTSLADFRTLHEGDTLDGGTLLPGLAIPVAALFARLPAEE
jgi:Uma2 family endonuclease